MFKNYKIDLRFDDHSNVSEEFRKTCFRSTMKPTSNGSTHTRMEGAKGMRWMCYAECNVLNSVVP